MSPNTEHVITKPSQVGRLVRDWGILVLGLAIVVVALVVSARGHGSRDSLTGMGADAQEALYGRTIENLRAVCIEPADDLRGYCSEEASVALRLPQCDASCRALAKPFTNRPTR